VRKMKSSRIFYVLAVTCALLIWSVAALAQDIRYNYSRGTDFAKYKTYKWVRVPNAQYPNSIIDEQIKQAIDTQLGMKGLTKTDDNPDLYVTYQIAINQEKEWNAYSTGGGPWGWGGWRGWGGMSTTTVTSSTINVGTLDCDIYDVATKKQIWRGEVSKTLSSGKDPKKMERNLNKAMEKLFKKYPPPPES
jgi:hypothetical protein